MEQEYIEYRQKSLKGKLVTSNLLYLDYVKTLHEVLFHEFHADNQVREVRPRQCSHDLQWLNLFWCFNPRLHVLSLS